MQNVSFHEAVSALIKKDPRYDVGAYEFVRDALEFTIKKNRKGRQAPATDIPTSELLDGIRLYALNEFGPMAITVLDFWGVRSTEDIGNIVFALVDVGVFSKTENDTLEEFRKGYSFEDAFLSPFRPRHTKSTRRGAASPSKPIGFP